MKLEERHGRWAAMMEKLDANTLTTWRDSFLEVLRGAPYEI